MRAPAIVFFALFFLTALWCPAAMIYTYPKNEAEDDHRYDDLQEILSTALTKTKEKYGEFILQPSEKAMNESRGLLELQRSKNITVAWSSSSPEKEKEYHAVKIPLRKGIMGYRIALIPASEQKKLKKIKSLSDLQHFSVGQGLGWGDIEVYKKNHIEVQTAPYESLFFMTEKGRVDLFPRGINEVFHEYETYQSKAPQLAIESSFALYYPWPYYFFLAKGDTLRTQRLEEGLQIMLKDGSFDKIFLKYNGEAIKKANLKNRRIIKLENPLLPSDTPLNDKKLWYDPLAQ